MKKQGCIRSLDQRVVIACLFLAFLFGKGQKSSPSPFPEKVVTTFSSKKPQRVDTDSFPIALCRGQFSGHFGPFLGFSGHFRPFFAILTLLSSFPIISVFFGNSDPLLSVFLPFWPFLAIFGHFGHFGHLSHFGCLSHFHPFSTIHIHFHSLLSISNHFLPFLAIFALKF